jgi:hydrophobic/amphiphilic exporter-1 (mainly G- bacteria), HAE1 family
MNISELSIKRPVFMTCVLLLLIVLGLFSFKKLPVDLFPDVTFPVVMVTTPYPGAGPKEIETLVSKPIEEEVGTISGIKVVRSSNQEGVSVVVAEFTLETDVKYAEQQVRDKVSSARVKLPDDVLESTIRRLDPADMPIMIMALSVDLKPGELFDLADEVIRPKLEQVNQVGLVEIIGGRKREIHVELDREKLSRYNLSVAGVSDRLAASGQNIPAGTVTRESQGKDMVFRTVGEFESVQQIEQSAINFFGNDVPVTLKSVGKVTDTLKDPESNAYWNGKPTLLLFAYKQSGANSVAVSNALKKRILETEKELQGRFPGKNLSFRPTTDLSEQIHKNVIDVYESIAVGITLTILVVYFFLGSLRSTLITGVAIPVSLIGAFTFMDLVGFNINVMSLLAFSLAVGLLIDDAIVVRENIFRHMEMGKSPKKAALDGTLEVTLAVIAVTLTIISVFGPIGFLNGVIGQFFKSFGITVCFIMMISLFDALTNAPMMSAYLGGGLHNKKQSKGFMRYVRAPVVAFDRFQTYLENKYYEMLKYVVRKPYMSLIGSLLVVLSSVFFLSQVPKTFLPPQDNGEFSVGLDTAPGTSLEKMSEIGLEIDNVIRSHPEVVQTVMFAGNAQGEKNKAEFYVKLTEFGTRDKTTSDVKADMREMLSKYKEIANPVVKDIDMIGGGLRPFTLNIVGQDLDQVQKISEALMKRLKDHPALSDVDTSWRPGKPEFQVQVDLLKAQELGVTSAYVGRELRAQVEGLTPAVFRQNGVEYDIRVRLKPEQRDLEKAFNDILVPNMNGRMVKLTNVAEGESTTGPATIDRENRGRFVRISADIATDGPGMGAAMTDIDNWFKSDPELKLPEGVTYRFVGQAENFIELMTGMAIAAGLGLIFIYLVLASLYESFMTPFTIMLVIPLAACGAFFALWAFGGSLDLFAMIGCIMLMGLAVKNSIILVDYIEQLRQKGMDEMSAILEAGKVRLRPILMTSFALISGMIPVAIGLNEVSNQRTSLGMTIIGGTLSSTLLTLVVIPCVYSYMERFKRFMKRMFSGVASADVLAENGGPAAEVLQKPLK